MTTHTHTYIYTTQCDRKRDKHAKTKCISYTSLSEYEIKSVKLTYNAHILSLIVVHYTAQLLCVLINRTRRLFTSQKITILYINAIDSLISNIIQCHAPKNARSTCGSLKLGVATPKTKPLFSIDLLKNYCFFFCTFFKSHFIENQFCLQ